MYSIVLASLSLVALETPKPDTPLTENDKHEVRAFFDKSLNDGRSARYEWPNVKRKGAVVCGRINAKNLFGAYTGWHDFYYWDGNGAIDGQTSTSRIMIDAFCGD